MFVPRSVDRLRPNKDRQTCQAPRADSTPEPAEARPLPSRIPSSPGDPRAPGPSNDGATDHAPARRVRPPGAASGRLPATNGGTEDLLPVLSLARSRSPVSRLLAPRPPSSQRSSTKAPILGRFASTAFCLRFAARPARSRLRRLLISHRGDRCRVATSTRSTRLSNGLPGGASRSRCHQLGAVPRRPRSRARGLAIARSEGASDREGARDSG